MFAVHRLHQTRSLRLWCGADGHWWGSQMFAPSRPRHALYCHPSVNHSLRVAVRGANRRSPLCGDVNASSRALFTEVALYTRARQFKWPGWKIRFASVTVWTESNKKPTWRWDSERKLSLRRHRTRTTKYNRLVPPRIDAVRPRCWNAGLPKFSEITQCNGHYAVQGHSRSPILVPIESSYTTSY